MSVFSQLMMRKKSGDNVFKGLCFTAQQSNSTFKYTITGSLTPTRDIKYSIDGSNWSSLSANTVVTLQNVGDKVYLKGNNPNGFSTSNSNYIKFVMTGKISASGNINSLIDDNDGSSITEIPNDYCFVRLFQDCSSLTSCPDLPATILKTESYGHLFFGTSVEIPPVLPALQLTNYCYVSMFENSKLTKMPDLPSTQLALGCYYYMFSGCSYLTQYIDELPATTVYERSYGMMFQSTPIGNKAPYIRATNATNNSYWCMFRYSTVNKIKLDYTGNFSSSYFDGWVTNVSSTGDFYYNGSDNTRADYAIPSNWNIHTF